MVKKLLTVPKPVVAAINGRCHGAGWVIALACDFRVARADALVGDIRSSKAIFAGQSVPLILSRLIGQSRTMDLLITGRVIDAVEAERYGIVTRLWPVETYEQDLAAFIAELADGPTQTYAAWKLAVNRSVLLELKPTPTTSGASASSPAPPRTPQKAARLSVRSARPASPAVRVRQG